MFRSQLYLTQPAADNEDYNREAVPASGFFSYNKRLSSEVDDAAERREIRLIMNKIP